MSNLFDLLPGAPTFPEAFGYLDGLVERDVLTRKPTAVLPNTYQSQVRWTLPVIVSPGTVLYGTHTVRASAPVSDTCYIGFEFRRSDGTFIAGGAADYSGRSGSQCFDKEIVVSGSKLVPDGTTYAQMFAFREPATAPDTFFYVTDPYMGRTPASIASRLADTIISQYANSPIITGILADLAANIDQSANLDAFYTLVWNVETAQGWGLDVLGRIVGVRRVLRVPVPGTYLGFQQDAGARPFGYGVWYGLGSSSDNYTLTDDAYRRLILAKAALNITDASIPSINRILRALFTGYGNVYVRDDGDMELTYVFSAPLNAVDYAIVTQSGVLPKPVGVTASGESP